jgi:hypothetical protein
VSITAAAITGASLGLTLIVAIGSQNAFVLRPGLRREHLGPIVLFCAVGRRNHAESVTLSGVVETAWPFLAGLAAGWLLCRAWRRPTEISPTGLAVWLGTVVIGMGIRAWTGAGVALSFVVVATLTTGTLLLGWRAIAAAAARRRGR